MKTLIGVPLLTGAPLLAQKGPVFTAHDEAVLRQLERYDFWWLGELEDDPDPVKRDLAACHHLYADKKIDAAALLSRTQAIIESESDPERKGWVYLYVLRELNLMRKPENAPVALRYVDRALAFPLSPCLEIQLIYEKAEIQGGMARRDGPNQRGYVYEADELRPALKTLLQCHHLLFLNYGEVAGAGMVLKKRKADGGSHRPWR